MFTRMNTLPVLRLAGLLAAVLLMSGCASESVMNWLVDGYKQSSLDVKSTDQGPDIMSLYTTFTWLSIVIFFIVEAVLIYAVVRFRKKKDQTGEPEQVHGNTRVEIAWTIAPALIVLFIAIPTIKTIFKLADMPQGDDVVKVRVVGKQWWWHFEYPELGIQTANELHLPVGRAAAFNIESDDVIHSFWFPQMGGKRDATPGHVNFMYFTPAEPGEYLGACAEYCGTSHANMRMKLIVHEEADFQAWVDRQKSVPAAVTADEHADARDAFMSNCAACHAVRGVAEFGRMGPDLTHFGDRTLFASGMFPSTTENLTKWLDDPQAMKPGALMQLPQELDEETIRSLVAFLQDLK